jgi:hypothetical protein
MTLRHQNDIRMVKINLAVEQCPKIFGYGQAHQICDEVIKELENELGEKSKEKTEKPKGKKLHEEQDLKIRDMLAHAYLHKRFLFRLQGDKEQVAQMYDKVKEWNPDEPELLEPRYPEEE